MALELTDFDLSGLDADTLALIDATAGEFWYIGAPRTPLTGTLLAGELGIGASNTVITRFRRHNILGTLFLVLNDDNNPGPLSLIDYFGTGGAGNDLTLHLQDDTGHASMPVAGQIDGTGGDAWIRFRLTTAVQTVATRIDSGGRFLFALTRPSPALRAIINGERVGGIIYNGERLGGLIRNGERIF